MKYSLIVTLLAAAPALADCPVAADLETGIRVTESDGTTNTFRLIDDGIVQNDGVATDGYTYRNLLAQGTHLIGLSDTENGNDIPDTVRTMTYAFAPAGMPIPEASSSRSYQTTVTSPTSVYPETQTQAWGAMTTLTIGDCTYDMIPGKLTYTNTDYVVYEGLYYLPDVGLGLLHSYQIQGDPVDRYQAIKIEALQ
ncbi:hypothetical protein L0666_10505 [Octadecabacter sp. CECT 8868]|uniref:hypothetical protein n=1 Tax=Octadecabacter algicola TaxID=2909342 RepID=UPI001F207DCA|nr:hypothetical protein [Octadecabacter algicola]MCF2905421.1 hypothetical protein [Octadecabacter algicola]